MPLAVERKAKERAKEKLEREMLEEGKEKLEKANALPLLTTLPPHTRLHRNSRLLSDSALVEKLARAKQEKLAKARAAMNALTKERAKEKLEKERAAKERDALVAPYARGRASATSSETKNVADLFPE